MIKPFEFEFQGSKPCCHFHTQSRFLGRGCDEALFSEKKEVFSVILRADFWEGDATKHFSVKKGVFSEKG